MKIADYEIA